MAEAANPFEAVQAMMLENLERVQSATQSYIDTVERAMRGIPGANDEQITTFKAYIERNVAANRDFVEKLLRAKKFPRGFPHSGRIFSVSTESGRRRRTPNWYQNGEFIQNRLRRFARFSGSA
jgi:hypothetical protein